jgi:hypothetical protein
MDVRRRRFFVILAVFSVWVLALGVMAVTTAVRPRTESFTRKLVPVETPQPIK